MFGGGALADEDAEVWYSFLNLSTWSNGYQYIGIITAATEAPDSQELAQEYIDMFINVYGAQKVEWVPIDNNHTSNANSSVVAAKLALMTGVFFGGGDQMRIKNIMMYQKNGTGPWYDTLSLATIRTKAWAGQMAIGGSSAGTDIIQKSPMVCGGVSYLGLLYGPFVYDQNNMDSDLLTYDPAGGFGLYNYSVFIDTHVGTRGRQGRDISLIYHLINNSTLGIGLDENTGIQVQDDAFQVVGVNGVYIFDLSQAKNISNNWEYFNVQDVYISYLTKGDKYNITSRAVQFASWKSNIAGHQKHNWPKSTYDIFSYYNNKSGEVTRPEEFTNITQYFMDSKLSNYTYGDSYEDTPMFTVEFDKTNAVGYIQENQTDFWLSYTNMKVSISVNRTKSFEQKIFSELKRREIEI